MKKLYALLILGLCRCGGGPQDLVITPMYFSEEEAACPPRLRRECPIAEQIASRPIVLYLKLSGGAGTDSEGRRFVRVLAAAGDDLGTYYLCIQGAAPSCGPFGWRQLPPEWRNDWVAAPRQR